MTGRRPPSATAPQRRPPALAGRRRAGSALDWSRGRPEREDHLAAWHDATLAADLAERLAASASGAAGEAGPGAEEIASMAEHAAEAAGGRAQPPGARARDEAEP